MAKTLTSKALENLKPAPVRIEVPDGLIRGLFFLLQPSGKGSWAVRYRYGQRTRKLTLGTYPAIDLKSARDLASRVLVSVAAGSDPAAEKRERKQGERTPHDHHLTEKAVERFIERYAKPNTRESSWREAERILKKEIADPWRGRKLAEITRSDIHAVLDGIVDRRAPIAANRSLAVMRRFFGWCVEREIIPTSPCDGVKAPAQARSRDRVLCDDEVRAVWKACDVLGWPFGPLVQLLVLTGQRRDEVAEMRRAEIDWEARTWIIPKQRCKNGVEHVVPLTGAAIAILKALPRIKSKTGLVFTSTGETPVSGFSRAKVRIDESVLKSMRKAADESEEAELVHWTLHDLRRTAASGMARLGIPVHVVEAVLNHKSGTIKGVAAVYNRYSYDVEKRMALDDWAQYILRLTKGDAAADVVEFAKRDHGNKKDQVSDRHA